MTTNGSNRSSTNASQERHSGAGGNFGDLNRMMLSKLSRTIEGDIIPRLMLAFDSRKQDQATEDESARHRLDRRVPEFVDLVLTHDAAAASDYVSALRSQGIPLSTLYLDLLAPAARRLGVMWEEDECSFTEVTIGVCRMHEVLLEFSRCFDAPARSVTRAKTALVVPAVGEQHTFGLFMVVEFLRRAGWTCWTGTPATGRDFRRLVRARRFDVVGISVGADRHLEQAAEQVAEIRRLAGSGIPVVVGGRPFLESPSLASRIGADATAADGREAVKEFNSLCRNVKRKTSG